MAENNQITADSDDIVVTANKQKIPHYDSGKAPSITGSVRDAVLGGGGGGIAGSATRWIGGEIFDGIRRGDLTPDMAGRVQLSQTCRAVPQTPTAAIFNSASGALKDHVVDKAVGMVAGSNVVTSAILGAGGAIKDEEKFKDAHKKLIHEMAERGVPGYEHVKVTINGKEQDIYVDASGTAQYPHATPIVYRPSGGQAKDAAENLRDKAATDVQIYIEDHAEVQQDGESIHDRKAGVAAYEGSVNGAIKDGFSPKNSLTQSPQIALGTASLPQSTATFSGPAAQMP